MNDFFSHYFCFGPSFCSVSTNEILHSAHFVNTHTHTRARYFRTTMALATIFLNGGCSAGLTGFLALGALAILGVAAAGADLLRGPAVSTWTERMVQTMTVQLYIPSTRATMKAARCGRRLSPREAYWWRICVSCLCVLHAGRNNIEIIM